MQTDAYTTMPYGLTMPVLAGWWWLCLLTVLLASCTPIPAHAPVIAPQADAATAWKLSLLVAGSLFSASATVHLGSLALARRRGRDYLRLGHQRFRTMFEQAPMGIALIDTVSGQFLDINPRYLVITGRSLPQLRQSNWMTITHPDDIASEQQQLAQLLAQQIRSFRHCKRLLRPDGEVVWVDASVAVIDTTRHGRMQHLCMLEDVTARRHSEALIWRQANFDALTGLPNRCMFQERLRHALAQARRDSARVALLFIDLDHFKEVNDTLGHQQGDVLLMEAAQRICACVRETDTVARLGGDEFTVIVADVGNSEQVERIACHILDSLLAPFVLELPAQISASIGITLYPDHADSVEALLKQADQAMYLAKSAGRNCYRYVSLAGAQTHTAAIDP